MTNLLSGGLAIWKSVCVFVVYYLKKIFFNVKIKKHQRK